MMISYMDNVITLYKDGVVLHQEPVKDVRDIKWASVMLMGTLYSQRTHDLVFIEGVGHWKTSTRQHLENILFALVGQEEEVK